MSGSLSGKVAIVTGASKGIGAAIAKGLAEAGASVVVNYASSRDGAEKVVAEIEKAGGKAVALHGSVAKAAEVKRLFVEAHEAYGRLDILVNNAGVYAFHPIEDVTEAEFHREFDTNVLGPILATQEAVKRFGAEGGSVINISSVASTKAWPERPSTAPPRPRSTRSRATTRSSSRRGKSASTRSPREVSRPRARTARASSAATSRSRWSPTRRSAASASRTTSPASRCSSPPMPRAGSPASVSSPRAVRANA